MGGISCKGFGIEGHRKCEVSGDKLAADAGDCNGEY